MMCGVPVAALTVLSDISVPDHGFPTLQERQVVFGTRVYRQQQQ